MQKRNLRIGESNLKNGGLGLFNAKQWRPRNTVVAEYTGTTSNQPINGNYVLEVNKNKFINSNRSIDIAGFANDCRTKNKQQGECRGNNCKFTLNRQTQNANLVTTKKIAPNEELYVGYGRDYWSKMPRHELLALLIRETRKYLEYLKKPSTALTKAQS